MLRNCLGFVLVLSLLSSVALAAPPSDSAQPAALPILTQDQASIYLACLEESSLASSKDGNPLGAINKLNALWVKTVKHTSLKGITMLQLAQITDNSIRALAGVQFGNPSQTGKVWREFATKTPSECLTTAQLLQ
ncbi:MAG TPA: hypothetical protein VMV15_06390 [Candidatus Binataceae bacterium]|nr:hypothetical protein [Candidatus Binataceae bacterium]